MRHILILSALFASLTLPSAFAAEKPNMLTRSQWGTKQPITRLMKRQQIKQITIHHSATKQRKSKSLARKLKGLQAFSQRKERLASGKMKKAWGDIPYHFYIAASGQIGEARELKYAGDTNTGYNTLNQVQIVVEGNFETEHPTAAQKTSLRKLVSWLRGKYNIPASLIKTHKQRAQTACPGKNLEGFIKTLGSAL